ncbi:GNAT family N-acetyltransferase [Saccharibacillus sp. CPCC 101409]|uniref:GNAT family N-acetyltransferase n=1 Tax=Saccharibacillus sp. CPCC 101409 TaxID=3058041 RepID=UPI0026732E24|nr:GNAT family N-acetyltransferase [Saccharibacillus sp. CPCC 101409]MDO3411129.1 GNAT family N-acetyltransferase [Saccharibacillus sp. CPCC 101409]
MSGLQEGGAANGSGGARRILDIDETLRLRSYSGAADIAAAEPWYRDREVLRMSEGMEEGIYDAAAIGRMYDYLQGSGELYMIETQEGGRWRPIGDAALTADNVPITVGDSAYRSRGVGRRVLERLIARARELRREVLNVGIIYDYNERSQRLYTGLGFRAVGEAGEGGIPGKRYELRLDAEGAQTPHDRRNHH